MNENVGTESQASATERPVVLVADDEPSMLELVSQHLKTMHQPTLEVVEASDGEQAWKLAQEILPDLVVLDVMMPGMSGWEVCRKIREDVALAHTAVVMLTGIGENLNQMTSPLYGADGYLDKPFEFEELDEKVREALAARAQQRGGIQRPKTNGVHHAEEPEDDEELETASDDGGEDIDEGEGDSVPPDEDTADDLERAAASGLPTGKRMHKVTKAPAKAPAKKKAAKAPATKKTAAAPAKKTSAPARKKAAAPAKKKTVPVKKAGKKTPAKKAAAPTKKTATKKFGAPKKKAAPAKKAAKKSAAKKATPAKKKAATSKTGAPKKKTAPARKKAAKAAPAKKTSRR